MKPLSAFVPDIIDDLHGVPDYLAEKHLIHAARKFCIETGILRESIEIPIIPANQSEFTLATSTPTQTEIYSVYRVYLDGLELPMLNDEQLDARSDDFSRSRYATLDHVSGAGSLNAVKLVARNKLKLVKTPEESIETPMIVTATLIPTVTATELRDDLFDYHIHSLKAGAKASLLVMVNQPWSAPELSEYWRMDFTMAMERERAFQRRRDTNRPMRVRARPFV